MSLKDELLVKMQQLGIEPKRSLGQNFLIGEVVLEKIFEHLDRRKPSFVIEVGPGLGTLTERLIERKLPRKIVELDRKFADYWRKRGEDVIEEDALKLNWNELNLPLNTMLLSNLPYQIGSRLVIELSTHALNIEVMVLMFQREVAERLAAKPRNKDYGFLTVVAQTYWSIDNVVDARAGDFFPAPNVLSRVISLKRRKVDARLDAGYIEFVKMAFQFRRKFMLKSLNQDTEKFREIFKKFSISETTRAEELQPQEFQKIFIAYKYGES